ncbi:MAG: TetR/AcrR family transcriptional regulator [Solirubrobacterales bacterium]
MAATAPTAARRRSGKAAERPLSRELIADAALELIDREGVDALSMRRLAAALGIGTMTIYGYFSDKQELLNLTIERSARRYELRPGEGDWRTRLRELIETMYRSLLEHPSMVQIRSSRPILNPGAIRACEAGMTILTDAGFELNEAAAAWRLLFTYLFGYAAFSSQEPPPELRREWAEELSALPEDDYPLTSSSARVLSSWMAGREPFEAGLELILDGLEARLEKGG